MRFVVFLFILFLSNFSTLPADAVAFLSQEDWTRFLHQEASLIEQMESDTDRKEIKLGMLKRIKAALTHRTSRESVFDFVSQDGIFDIEMCDVFKGSPKKALDLYADLTMGRQKPGLFVLSGAGQSEVITDLNLVSGGFGLTTDRVYVSQLAYNTKNKVQVFFYEMGRGVYVVVNRHVEDFGRSLKSKDVKKENKPYGPIDYDLTVDIYWKTKPGSFQFHSFNAYQGQTEGSRYGSVNAIKSLGNILTLGTLDKGISAMVKKSAEEIWLRRRERFQELILQQKR